MLQWSGVKGFPTCSGKENFPVAVKKYKLNLHFVVYRETNSIACHGAPGVSNTAGAALWAIDYTLQAATLGMIEVYFHEGVYMTSPHQKTLDIN